MPLTGEYEPSPSAWVREQVELYEKSNGQQGNTLMDTGLPVVVFTMYGRKSGKLRKVPLMRVEHDGKYVLVASKGGAPENPEWDANLRADPRISVQDGSAVVDGHVRELSGDERAQWWERAAAAFPTYNEYQQKTDRQIPVWLLEPDAS